MENIKDYAIQKILLIIKRAIKHAREEGEGEGVLWLEHIQKEIKKEIKTEEKTLKDLEKEINLLKNMFKLLCKKTLGHLLVEEDLKFLSKEEKEFCIEVLKKW